MENQNDGTQIATNREKLVASEVEKVGLERAARREAACARRVERRKPKSPWNSLEVAKLAVSSLMALVIAAIGIYATRQAHQQDVDRVERENLRARKAKADPIVAEFRSDTIKTSLMHMNLWDDGGPVASDPYERAKQLSGKQFAYEDRMNERWRTLRYLVNDDARFDKLIEAYEKKVKEPLNWRAACRLRDISKDLPPNENCRSKLVLGDAPTTCADAIATALNSFESLPIRYKAEDIRLCELPSTILVPRQPPSGDDPFNVPHR